MVRKNCRIRKVPNALPNMPGTVIDQGVLTQLNQRMSIKLGTSVTVAGIIRVPR